MPDAYYCQTAAEAGDEYVIVSPHDDVECGADGEHLPECKPLLLEFSIDDHYGRHIGGMFAERAASLLAANGCDPRSPFSLTVDDDNALAADDAGELEFTRDDGTTAYASDWVTSLIEDAETSLCMAGFYVDWFGGVSVYSVES